MSDEIVTPPVTPETTPPPNPSPTSETLELYDRILADKQREIDELKRTKESAPPPEATPDSTAFFQDPHKFIAELIDHKLAETTAPINKFVAVERRRAQLRTLRAAASVDPRVVKFWPHIEAKFDSMAENFIQENDVTPQIVGTTIYNLVAQFAMEQPSVYGKLLESETTLPQAPKVIPPSIPPSAPPAPETPTTQAPTLNENEMRLARERWPNLPTNEAYKKYSELLRPGSFVVEPKKKA